MHHSLKGISNKAFSDRKHRFGGIYQLLNVENLKYAYSQLNKQAAVGVDQVTYEEYGQNLDENIEDLVRRLKNKSYKARLVKRVFIPKSATQKRPLGLPVLEDKLLQWACSKILESIYEADFIEQSYGYRPGKSAHDAVDKLGEYAQLGPFNYVVEADIKGFFDNINHDWMLDMLNQRIDDRAFVGLIRKWLKAGILEDGNVIHPQSGTPQGGVISPILANIYLHYALDLWLTRRFVKANRGAFQIIRYADDFVCLFQKQVDAERFYQELPLRLAKFGLEVASDKTKMLKFSTLKKPEDSGTFIFLGFEFRMDYNLKKQVQVRKYTALKKLRKGIDDFKEWIKKSRSQRIDEIMKTVRRKFLGHYNYYGRIGNYERLKTYYYRCIERLFKWLNRRSQRSSFTWPKFLALLSRHQIPLPRITQTNTNKA